MISSKAHRRSERGFTLAAVLVILSVMLVFLAFTVPRMWSDVLKRERDVQTMWVMKQYARAIKAYVDVRKVYPTKLSDLKDQNHPRVIRQLYPNPLSGELDWVLVPFGTPSGDQLGNPNPNQLPPPGPQQKPGGDTAENPPVGVTPGAASGPFIGVRPPQKGKSMVAFRGKEDYAEWLFTTNELDQEINASLGIAAGAPGAPPPQTPGGGNAPSPPPQSPGSGGVPKP